MMLMLMLKMIIQMLRILKMMVQRIGLGLLTAARVLRWLFARVPDVILAILVGLMVGSIRKLWPFVEISGDGRELLRLPGTLDGSVAGVAATFTAGVLAVLVLENLGRGKAAERDAHSA